MSFLSKYLIGASYLLRELLARAVSTLISCSYLDFITRLKINRATVLINIMLLLLLYKHNIAFSYTLYIIYMLSKFHGLFLIKRLISIRWLYKAILVLGYIRLKPFKKLKRTYLDTLII